MKNYIIQHQSVLNSAEMLRLLTQTQSNTEEIQVAQKTIHIIDNYIGLKTLILLKSVSANVKVTIFSDNIGRDLHRAEFADFKREYPNVDITLKTTKGIYHDRYIIIDHGTSDEIIFHCGGSSKDCGRRTTSISRVEDVVLYQDIIACLQDNPLLRL